MNKPTTLLGAILDAVKEYPETHGKISITLPVAINQHVVEFLEEKFKTGKTTYEILRELRREVENLTKAQT